MKFITEHTRVVRSSAALGLMLALLVGLTTFVGVGFTNGSPSLAQVTPTPEAYFNQSPPNLDVPDFVLIGETFTFNVRFKNTGNAIGYGPFIDLAMDYRGADDNTQAGPCDGIEFLKADMIAVNPPLALSSLGLTFTNALTASSCAAPPNTVSHHYNSVGQVALPKPGWQLATMELPFGSFDPSQPEIVVQVTAKVHDFADADYPLDICTRGGFHFGSTPTVGTPILEQQNDVLNDGWECLPVIPKVFTVKKEYIGPEDETATGPNFEHKYKITLDVATGQNVGKDLTITDCLANSIAYEGNLSVIAPPLWPAYGATEPTIGTVNNPTASCLVVVWHGSFVAGIPGPDAIVEFEFTVRDVDADGNVLLTDCQPVLVPNGLTVTGPTWDPQDPRDSGGPISASDPTLHELKAKCLAIQKSFKIFTDTGAGGPTPGDILEYTLDFQISDYKTIGQIQIVDRLSDGQLFIGAPAPTLSIGDQFGSYNIAPFPTSHYSDNGDPHSTCLPGGPPQGTTNLVFDVSGALAAIPPAHPRHLAGILTGGYATAPTSTTPATGTLVIYAQIRDDFSNPQSPGDIFIDKHDPINNCVDIQGTVYMNEAVSTTVPTPLSPTQTALDSSFSGTSIVTDILKKSVYQVTRGNTVICGSVPACPAPPSVLPGDQVTFRIEYSIPSGDAENLLITDWLPLPVFDVIDPNADNSPGPGWILTNGICGIPTSGEACFGPTNTLVSPPLVVGNPTILANNILNSNSLEFDYGTFNNPANMPLNIDLLFTITVTSNPFADGLFLTNEVQECEDNTFDTRFCQTAVAHVLVREPKLSIQKGVIATDNPNGVFSPALTAGAPVGVPPLAPCPRFTPTINSSNLSGFINSDLSGVDAGDWVTFAIAIENTGGAPAYEIELADIIPLDATDRLTCFDPDFGGMCVTDGNGIPIPFTTAPGGHGRLVIELLAPLAPFDPLNGTNIAILTFNAQLLDKDQLKSGCCKNRAELIRYTSSPDPTPPAPPSPNFVDAGFGGPFEDTAMVCVGPSASAKCIQTTSELHTTPQDAIQSGVVDATIGEIIRFRLVMIIPEGTTLNLQVQDNLPPGLTYVGNPSILFVANNPVTSPPGFWPTDPDPTYARCPGKAIVPPNSLNVGGGPFVPGQGTDPFFFVPPYNILNSDTDSDLEYAVIEFNAQVDNILNNQMSSTLTNTYLINYEDQTGGTYSVPSGPVHVHVVEPELTLTKTPDANSVGPGGTVTYTIDIANTGTSDAFEILFTDTLPAGLALSSVTALSVCTDNSSGNTVSVSCPQLDELTAMQIIYQATVSTTVPCNTTLTNTAKVTWTSLPGPNGTLINPTGSQTGLPPGSILGERDGSDGLLNSGVLNDYQLLASATITVVCRCDLAIMKTVAQTATGLLVTITLTVPVGQICPPGAVVVGDQQPAGMTFNLPGSLVVSPAADWNCGATTQSNLSCVNVPTLTGLYTATFTFTATAPPGISIINCATATVSGVLVSQSCVTFSVSAAQCDLTIAKTVDPNPPVTGQPFAFVVTITNAGTAPCQPATTVTDNLPTGFTVTQFSPNSAGGWICPSGPPNISCNNPTLTLQPNQSSLVFIVQVTASPGILLQNCATVTNTADADPSNNSSCVDVSLTAVCDLEITKTATPNSLKSGAIVTITITLKNVGGADCPPGVMGPPHGTLVQDLQPAGLIFNPVPAAIIAGSTTPPLASWGCGINSNSDFICFNGNTLPAGYQVTFTFTATVSALPGSSITNCATVKNSNDVNPANNQSCVTIQATQFAIDLRLDKTLDGDLRPGQAAVYNLKILNVGSRQTSGAISVTDLLPSSLTLVSISASGWSCGSFGQIISCNTNNALAPGQSSTILITVRVKAGEPGAGGTPPGTDVTNCAAVNLEGDEDPDNNRACHSGKVEGDAS